MKISFFSLLLSLSIVYTWGLCSYSYANQDKGNKTEQSIYDPDEKIGKEIFGEWLTNLSVAGTEQVWDYLYNGRKDKSTLTTEKETFAKISLHLSNPYSHLYHYGIRFHEIIYYNQNNDDTMYIFAPEFTFGRNLMCSNWIGIRLYGGVGTWIKIISNGNRRADIAYSFGLQIPLRIGGLYIMPFSEYNINIINGLQRSLIYGIGIGW